MRSIIAGFVLVAGFLFAHCLFGGAISSAGLEIPHNYTCEPAQPSTPNGIVSEQIKFGYLPTIGTAGVSWVSLSHQDPVEFGSLEFAEQPGPEFDWLHIDFLFRFERLGEWILSLNLEDTIEGSELYPAILTDIEGTVLTELRCERKLLY